MTYYDKYIQYKAKYLQLKDTQLGGSKRRKRRLSRQSMNADIHKFHVSEPWFTLISLGLKTVEGRKNKGIFKEMKSGDIIEWENSDFGHRSIQTKVVGKAVYKSFKEYLENEGLENCLPGITNIENGLAVYYRYYSKKDEAEYGVVAIRLERI